MARILFVFSLLLNYYLILNFDNICYIKIDAPEQIYDSIAYNELSVSGMHIGDNQQELLNKFGDPDTIGSIINEFEGESYLKYVYGESSFNFKKDAFIGFSIRDNIFSVDPGAIVVGDRMEKLKTKFPYSFANHFEGENSLEIKVRIGQTDSYVIFTCCNSIVTKIETWNE